MQLNNVFGTGSLVQTINVLSDEGKTLKTFLPLCELKVRQVGLQWSQQVSPVVKPLPHSGKITLDHQC